MNSAQYHFFNALVQSAQDSRIQLHEIAWVLLGVVLVVATVFLSGIWLWVLRGGFEDYFSLNSVHGQRVVQEWLRKS